MNIILFHTIFNLSTHIFIAKIAIFFSYVVMYVVPALLLLWSIFRAKNKMFTFSLFFLSGIFAWIAAALLKLAFHIPRPFIQEGIIPLVRESGFSFPSGHMTVFSALAVAGYFINKKLGIVLLIIAFLVGLSRIVIGVHTPIDIIGGFCVGSIVSFIIYFFKKI